ncbi:YdcF family protein [Massilia sp. MS-15]|uniref:YdcF family protein n=1 Tax=Massilia sp. MS-15 TaxID=2878200 RepID=UPI001CD7FDDC|nr:YdcF family protein [Massilia sp. MS-15]MCA1248840.1 YdcF family protein [Massilia sp. MS-15]
MKSLRFLVVAACAGLLLGTVSSPQLVADFLESPLAQHQSGLKGPQLQAVEVIVVLTGPADGVRARNRITAALALQRERALPLMVCGEGADGIQQVLQAHGLCARWIENTSVNTYENGKFCGRLLQQERIRTVLLVTDEYHMRRARMVFAWAGVETVAMPSTRLDQKNEGGGTPAESTWQRIRTAVHELGGILWYLVRHAAERRDWNGNPPTKRARSEVEFST